MPEGREELYERVLSAFHRGDADSVEALLTAASSADRLWIGLESYNDRELEFLVSRRAEACTHDMRPTGIPGMGLYEGRDGFMRFLHEWLEAFPGAKLAGHRIETAELDDGSWCSYVVSHQTMAGRGSGVPVEMVYAGVGKTGPDNLVVWTVFDTDIERARARFEEVAAGAPVP